MCDYEDLSRKFATDFHETHLTGEYPADLDAGGRVESVDELRRVVLPHRGYFKKYIDQYPLTAFTKFLQVELHSNVSGS
jgi:hypothetical protein